MVSVYNSIASRIGVFTALGLLAIFSFQCTAPNASSEGPLTEIQEGEATPSTEVEPVATLEPSLLADTRQVAQNLREIVQQDFSFEKQFPILHALLGEAPEVMPVVEAYARKAVERENLAQEEDLLALMEERDEKIIPVLWPYLENMEEAAFVENYEALDAELAVLGIQTISAEGFLTGLGPSSLFTQNLRIQQNTPIIQYDAFTDAETRSMSGEYPYADLDPFIRMILLGEQLENTTQARIYYEKVGVSFQDALHALTDVHRVTGEGARVGGIHVEAYPYDISLDQLSSELPRFEGSQYYGVISRIVENPSEMTSRPAHLHLLVVSWHETEEEASKQVNAHLHAGKDIPHYLPVEKGDGSTQYAVIYRFYEDAGQAEQGLARMKAAGIEGSMVFVTYEKDKLFQLGY